MSKKILIIEPDLQLTEFIRYPLEEEGYAVASTVNGRDGLDMARREQPDLLLVDFKLGKTMSGNQLCQRLRKSPATEDIRCIIIADESCLEELEIGPRGSADDFLIKPFSVVELVTKIKPLLISGSDQIKMISTGNGELDGKMGGGVPYGSLTLIEGDSGAGKSVLSQQMMYGSLKDGCTLSLFTSENTVKSLVKQMRSLNLDIMDYLLLNKIRIFPIETARLGRDAPPTLMKAIRREKGRSLVFIDSLTSSIPQSSDKEVIAFFEDGKRLCGEGTTVIIVVHSHGLTRELLTRIRSLCDAHLQLRTEEVGNKLVKTLEVTKVRGADQTTGNIISFEVEPGWGMRVIPINKVRG
ncbi:MAG: ATPase domain-containing protein [Chloroflexota bacterium]